MDLEGSPVPLTTRRTGRALAAALVAAALGVGPAVAASAAITPGSGPVSVAVVVPITARATTSGLISAEDLERYTGPFGILTRQLDAVAGTPAAIALDPMIPASIRVLGASAPVSASQWLARLQATSNEVFLLAYGDADLVAGARTGTLAQLTPSGFDFALDPDDFSAVNEPAPTPDPTATPTPDPEAPPPFPTTDDVLAWDTPLPRIAWPDATIAESDLPAFAAVGYEHVIVPSSSVGEPATPLVQLDGVRGIVSDTQLSGLVANAASASSPTVRGTALDAFETALANRTASTPGRGIVVTVDRGWTTTGTGLADVLARLSSTSSAGSATLSDVLATAPVPARLGAGVDTADRDEVFTTLASDAVAESAFASVLSEPAALLDPRRLERIALYSLAWRTDEDGWTDAVREFRDRSTELRSSVHLEHGSDVALLARNVDLKVTVSNALPFPVTVVVTADPRGPILRARETRELTIEPQSTGTARIPVEAIANGEVTVTTSIASPTGVPIDSGVARVTVRAEWEGIGTLVVVIMLALVFAAGLVRLIVVRRRGRRPDADETEEAQDAPAEGTDG
ncbi:MAG: hypothetical protein EAS51_03775 [Microbacteriaceae bacterium]|nr:MAG: hypothetical protein EAS51_03775 [Microbacteriaceae bacterium]